MTHGTEWDMEIWRPEVENVALGHDCVSYVLSYGHLQESWIISGLVAKRERVSSSAI